MALLAVEHLTFTYPGAASPAVRDVSFAIEAGEMICCCGATGSGKSTLLRLLKRELAPLGDQKGRILLHGTEQEALSDADAAYTIGYVMQRPEQQLVTDRVWHEMAFGLENMNVPQPEIARRVSEMAAYFGIEDWFDRPVSTLSGGQKQLLNLAAVMVMQPELLILDEPTAQLDPIAAADFIATVRKLNRELGLTVLITEHRLEEVVPVSDKLLVLEDGGVLSFGEPRRVISDLSARPEILCAMPAAARLHRALSGSGPCPLDVREGRRFITAHCPNALRALPEDAPPVPGEPALVFRDVYFRYERSSPDILTGLTFTVHTGEVYAILGGNGAGKTTALGVAAGLHRAYSGRVEVFGRKVQSYGGQSLYRECLTLLPQDVQTVFLRHTVREELAGAEEGLALLPFDLTHLYDRHPYDLSGGEQQLVALARVLATKPRLLLLDEPTKGVDAASRFRLAEILRSLRERGMTIVLVTHDVEFAALCANRCAMFFRGGVVSEAAPRDFFSRNTFYTTAVSRMTRGHYEGLHTLPDAVRLYRLNMEGGGAP